MSMVRNLLLAGVAVAMPLSVAQAATTIEYTSTIDYSATEISSGPNWLDGFDSSLGTLTGVQIEYGFGFNSEGEFTNTGVNATNFRFEADYNATFTFHDPATIAGDYGLDFTTGLIVYPTLDVGESVAFGPYSFFDTGTINPANISQFIDTDFSYSLETLTGYSMKGGGNNIEQKLATGGEGYVKVIYTYEDSPVVPEPATWAMLIAGFGMMGTALRRRRRVVSC